MLTTVSAAASVAEAVRSLPGCTVLSDAAAVAVANTATFATQARSAVIVQAQSSRSVAALLTVARQRRFRVSVISQGRNWGFGSSVPVENCEILLDLSLMNRIAEYDETFGTVRVEAGVSFRELADFLRARGGLHFLSVIGGTPDASVVGNLLERGDGTGPYWNRASHFCSPEIVLADGTRLELGFGGREGSRLKALSRDAPGPDLTSLLPQSGLAVVTAVTLWLQPVPEHFRTFVFRLAREPDLTPVLEGLRGVFRRNLLNAPVAFWNDYKRAASSGFRVRNVGSPAPLQRHELAALSDDHSVWTMFGGLYYDHPAITRAVYRTLRGALGAHVRPPRFFDHLSTRRVAALRALVGLIPKRWVDLAPLLDTWHRNPLLGSPSEAGVRGLYLRKGFAPAAAPDPHRDGVGVVWNAFEVPFDPPLVTATMARIETKILEHGFEPLISLVAADARVVRVFQQLVFDRERDGEDTAALACHRSLFSELEESGYNHVRSDCLSMQSLTEPFSQTPLAKAIKRAVDPEGLLLSGRYGI